MRADLLVAIHFHQPVGNFDDVIERVCDKCYVPFIETLKGYPGIKMSFHFTGCLLEWFEEKRPEVIEAVRGMVSSGQVEMISGGFYEPILPSIPGRDRLRQISLLSEYVRDNFSYEANGAWVAERVWEPCLPSVFHDSGIKYVILDDTHFFYSGLKKEDIYGYYMTEDNGKSVAVFPSDKILRYHIPFRMPEDCTGYMRGVASTRENPTFIYGDDGEKFGEWPGTHKWVYGEKWLVKFFDELSKNSGWLNTSHFSECLKSKGPLGSIYLPTASYEEMLEWALPADTQELYERVREDVKNSGKEEFYSRFFRGGFWRNFLSKYPESNRMNKRMLYVSGKVEALRGTARDEKALSSAEKHLFKGQCNCAYWHGVFGGLYLFHLRSAIYNNLIKADALCDQAERGEGAFLVTRVLDIDADGFDEVIAENRELWLCLAPSRGGAIKELDSKTACCNLTNVLTRRKEAYHRRIIEKVNNNHAKELHECATIHDAIQVSDGTIKDALIYDVYDRASLIDHFFDAGTDINAFSRSAHAERGDFVGARYSFDTRKAYGDAVIIMKREGRVDGNRVEVEKKIIFPREGACIGIEYMIKNLEKTPLAAMFATEFNLAMPYADSERYTIKINGAGHGAGLGDMIEKKGASSFDIHDREKGLSVGIVLKEACRIWHFPVKTVSQSETAYQLNYQGSCVLAAWELSLGGGDGKTLKLELFCTV